MEVTQRPGLLNSEDHGILVLDNAERSNYAAAIAAVPQGWLKAQFSFAWDTTIVWMACEMNHMHCLRARHDLRKLDRNRRVQQDITYKFMA